MVGRLKKEEQSQTRFGRLGRLGKRFRHFKRLWWKLKTAILSSNEL